MPDRRRHRGAAPGDEALFGTEARAALVRACRHLSWLLSRDYPQRGALKLVGDRFSLTARQRHAILRGAATEDEIDSRDRSRVAPEQTRGRRLVLDGFNVLSTVEAALGRGIVILARDRCFRDLGPLSGTYRLVEETRPALQLIGSYLQDLAVREVGWWLDEPMSNSRKLLALIERVASEEGWPWQARLVPDPDPLLLEFPGIIATSDRGLLNAEPRWLNLAREVVESRVERAQIVDLSP